MQFVDKAPVCYATPAKRVLTETESCVHTRHKPMKARNVSVSIPGTLICSCSGWLSSDVAQRDDGNPVEPSVTWLVMLAIRSMYLKRHYVIELTAPMFLLLFA